MLYAGKLLVTMFFNRASGFDGTHVHRIARFPDIFACCMLDNNNSVVSNRGYGGMG